MAIGVAPGRDGRAGGPARQLQRLGLERRPRPRTHGFRPREDLVGVVARRVRPRRRGAELDRRIEHPFQQGRRRHLQPRLHEGAQFVAGEEDHGPGLARCRQRLRMRHVGGGEDFRLLASGDGVADEARGPVRLGDGRAARGGEGLRDLGQRAAKAAGCVQQHRFGRVRLAHGYNKRRCGKDAAHLKPQFPKRWRRTAAGR
ncbi:MAG: hypothetical protein FD152_3875 [Xanthobacteraceae bacterium]|nr:MAG: hypothetical protein FD152_3875 [Xanthobacteraceae bacterium]